MNNKYTREQVLELMKASYEKGFYNGVSAYAWWKDGEQRVGTTGNTLKQALKKIENNDHYNFTPNFDIGNIIRNFDQEQFEKEMRELE